MSNTEKYTIAFEDSDELYSFFVIKRSPKGDIYVIFNEHHPGHKPQSTYRASGQPHHKGEGKIHSNIKILQPLDSKFNGYKNIITTTISQGNGRAGKVVCNSENYNIEFFTADDLLSHECNSQLSKCY